LLMLRGSIGNSMENTGAWDLVTASNTINADWHRGCNCYSMQEKYNLCWLILMLYFLSLHFENQS